MDGTKNAFSIGSVAAGFRALVHRIGEPFMAISYRPLKAGARLARKAATPSARSSV